MTSAIIVVARLESERLPQKHLKVVEGMALINWLTQRIKTCFQKEIADGLKLIVASPSTPLNERFEDLYKNDDAVETFRGDESNIPKRIMECSDKFSLDRVVVADGDNFLLSMEAIKAVLENLSNNTSVAKTEGLPLGMNVMGWDAQYLKATLNRQAYRLLETGWGRIFDANEIKKIKLDYNNFPQFDLLRFTTDYPEDLQFMEKMFQALGSEALYASAARIIQCAVDNKFYELNGFLSKIYFSNFYKKMDDEKQINHEEHS